MKFATLLLFLAVTAFGADPIPRTLGFVNGRAWSSLSEQNKLGFVIGFGDGVALSGVPIKSLFGTSTFGEITKGLDDFFRDPANLQITVCSAMLYFQKKVQGESPQELAEYVATLRQSASRAQQ